MSSIEKVFREWGLPVNFLDRYWRRTHVAGQITDRAHASGGLSELEIDSLLRQGLRSDRVSISTRGTYHHPIEYTTTKIIAGQPIADFIDPDRVRVLVERGATAILANVELWIPPVTNFAHLLADDFGCEVQAHIFLTGPERGGLVPHADGEDNFLIQVTGTKTWSLWKQSGVHAQRMDGETLGAPTAAVVLAPGDVLYIPVGWVHSAIAGPDGSTHITYQIVPTPLSDAVLDQLADELEPLLGDRLLGAPSNGALSAEDASDIAKKIVALLEKSEQS